MLSTILDWIALLLSIAALGISFVAMQFALTNKRSDSDYRRLLLHLSELEDLHEALAASHKRLRSRVGMRELRAKRASGDSEPSPESQETPEEWKKRARAELHAKQIRGK